MLPSHEVFEMLKLVPCSLKNSAPVHDELNAVKEVFVMSEYEQLLVGGLQQILQVFLHCPHLCVPK